ncbi:MAG: hypothetical protein KJ922_02110 [Nanoarchaeota archaeon]|nr:hypothetical protein [Nanoarchaeota archaeon]
MLSVIEAMYENGRLNLLEKVDGIKRARAIVIFLDKEKKPEEREGNLIKEELPEIILSEETVKEYEERLAWRKEKMGKEKDLPQDTFFSLKPVDLGYTNANLLDSIIANEAMGKERK